MTICLNLLIKNLVAKSKIYLKYLLDDIMKNAFFKYFNK